MKILLVSIIILLIFGCVTYKDLRQKEIKLYESWGKRYESISKKFVSNCNQCDELYKIKKPNYLLLKECYEEARKYAWEEKKDLDDDIKKYEDWKRHQELIDAIRRR